MTEPGRRPRRTDRASAVAGIAFLIVGTILLLDRLGELDLDLGGLWPLLAATAGAILLAHGLDDRRRP